MPYNLVPDSFHTAVTAEALRAKIGRKSAISHQAVTLIQTDRILIARPRLHCMQRGKNQLMAVASLNPNRFSTLFRRLKE